MKRYLVFFGLHDCPSGGMDDFLNDFDTIEECKSAIENRIEEGFNPDRYTIEEHIQYEWKYNWAHIYDTEARKEVWSK